jgi:hypothetical protein
MVSCKDIAKAKVHSAKSTRPPRQPQKNTWFTSDELRERWEINNKASLAQYVYDHLSELAFSTKSGKWLDEAWRRLGEKAMYGRIEWTNKLLKAVGGFDRGLYCRAPDKKYYEGLKEAITVVDILQNLDDMLWMATVVTDFERKHHVEVEDNQQKLEKGNSATQRKRSDPKPKTRNTVLEAPHLNDAASRRTAVEAYIAEVLRETGKRITRKDIWRRAGYKSRTEFERWERSDPKRRNKSADERFTLILQDKPHLK